MGQPPQGRVLLDLTIPGRAIPWKVPNVRAYHQDRDYRAFKSFQTHVRILAQTLWPGGLPDEGPVGLEMLFVMDDVPNGRYPDLTNLIKSTEDGLATVAFMNDRQVEVTLARRAFIGDPKPGGGVWEGPERTLVRVTSLT